MLLPVEYRSVIRFLLLRRYDKQAIISELSAAYGEEAPPRVYSWIQEFQSGRMDVTDRKSTGRPTEIGDDHRDKLQRIVREDRRITKKELAEKLNVSYGTAVNLLSELGIRKLCSRFVPYFLTSEMRDRRLQCCNQLIDLHQRLGDSFVYNIITEDETPLSLYLPDDRRSSKEFKWPGESATRKLRSGTSHRRCLMLTIFWNSCGVVHVDFADRHQRLNAEYYGEQVRKARQAVRKPRNQNLYLLHDNAPIHTAATTSTAINDLDFHVLPHPPYSPDLAPSDYYLFRHLKQHLRGERFDSSEDIKEAVMDFFNSRSRDFFLEAFRELPTRWRKCLENDGGYIEK